MKKYNYMKTINNNGDLSPPDNFRDHSHMFPSHWRYIILTLNFRISSFFTQQVCLRSRIFTNGI